MGLIKEFKDFAMRGNVVDMAVGIIIGGAFGKIVSSLVDDVIMPPIGLLLGGVDFAKLSLRLQEANAEEGLEEVVIRYGQFINVIINFLIVAFAIFMVIKLMNKAQEMMAEEETETPAEPDLTLDQQLLQEIRDGLKKQG